jgi:hypothetical protein
MRFSIGRWLNFLNGSIPPYAPILKFLGGFLQIFAGIFPLMETWFDIQYKRRHLTSKRSARDTTRVLAKTPFAAAKLLFSSLRRNCPAGVYEVIAIAPAFGLTESFQRVAKSARKAVRRAKQSQERLEVLRAIARGAKTSPEPQTFEEPDAAVLSI